MATKKASSKEWYTILAPSYFGSKEIGKTLTNNPERLVGRIVTINSIELTGSYTKYYLKLSFIIDKVNGGTALTEFYGSECLRDYLSRMVLRRVRKIDRVQDLVTKDGKKIRVKSLGVIGRRVKSSIQLKVSVKIKELLKEIVENSTLEELVDKIVSDEIKNRVLQNVRGTYPLRNFEIRKTEVR